jgi:YhcH/YjgK/YiaL family protein
MILDTLSESSRYEGLHPSFPKAFGWLRKFDPKTPEGKYEIDGPGVVAIVQSYSTAPASEKKWEAHRVHGDIQYMVSGSELIGCTPLAGLQVKTPYTLEKDAEFYEAPGFQTAIINLPTGSFAVFLPHDVHQPGVTLDIPNPVFKVVVKFRI